MEDFVDVLGCENYVATLADKLDLRLRSIAPVEWNEKPTAIYLVGSGALGGALDCVATVFSPLLELPIVRVDSHTHVRFGASAAIVAASFAGDTPETAEHIDQALAAGASVILAAAHGPLCDRVLRSGGVVLELDPTAPGPRWAFLETVGAIVALLSGLLGAELRASLGRDVLAGIDRYRQRVAHDDAPLEAARQLARKIDRTMVLAIGSGSLGAVAAKRLAAQIEENAKTFAVSLSYPAIGYSTVAGFGQCGDVTRQVFTAIELLESSEVPADSRRRAVVAEMLDEHVASRITLVASGDSAMEEFFDLVGQADRLSLALAAAVGIDPGPVPAIVEVKRAAAGLV